MALTKASLIDLNGQELILDADADTSITADTDDEIHFKVGGSETAYMGVTSYNASDRLVLTNTAGNASMTIVGGTSGESSIFMADGTSGDASYRGYVQYQHTNDNMNFGTAGAERMRIISGIGVGIGTTDVTSSAGFGNTLVLGGSGYSAMIIKSTTGTQECVASNIASGGFRLDVAGAASGGNNKFRFQTTQNNSNYNTYLRMCISATGNIGTTDGGTNIYNASDARLKQNINSLSDSLNIINNLNPVSFNWADNFSESEKDKTLYGFVAQEVQDVFPDAIEDFSAGDDIELNGETIENPLAVREKFIIPVLVKAMQEQQEQIEALQSEINTLKGE